MADIAAFFGMEHWPPMPNPLFWVSLTLVGGALLGEAVYRGLGLSRIVGYGAAGIAVVAAGFGFGEGRLLGNARLVVDLALALLLFELGSRVSMRWLRVNKSLLWTSALESLASGAAIFAVLRWFDFEMGVALVGAALTFSASATVIGRVSAELKSAGQVTERMLVLSALSTLVAVLTLKLVIGWLYMDQRGDWVQGVSQPMYTLAGSILLAAALGGIVAWVMRRFEVRDENSVLLLLGLVLLSVTAARMLGLSTLLVPLLAGVMLRNASDRPCIWPRHFGTAGGVLVLMAFVVIGSAWTVEALASGAVIALALLGARFVAKLVVLIATARVGGIEARQGLALSMALTPLSGTALVLLADLQASHPVFAGRLSPVVLSAIAIMSLAGPMILQWGLRLAHEYHSPRQRAAKERA